MLSINNNNQVSAFYSGVAALGVGKEQVLDASNGFANANKREPGSNLNTNAVTLIQGEVQSAAAVEVIKRSNEMLGSIIDIYV